MSSYSILIPALFTFLIMSGGVMIGYRYGYRLVNVNATKAAIALGVTSVLVWAAIRLDVNIILAAIAVFSQVTVFFINCALASAVVCNHLKKGKF
jgi:hypothetical protein